MNCFDYDCPDTYLPIVNNVVSRYASRQLLQRVSDFKPDYIDCASHIIVNNVDRVGLFTDINIELSKCKFKLYHATRLSDQDFIDISEFGFQPLPHTKRIDRLKFRVHNYMKDKSLKFNEFEFDKIVEKFQHRDDGAIFFSLSRIYHIKHCPHYLYFGSEFEQSVVAHFLSRYDLRLLRSNNRSAFVLWEVDGRALRLDLTEDAVHDCLSRGNFPDLANHVLNSWVLDACGYRDHIENDGLDYTVIFRKPFNYFSQEVIWQDESSISEVRL